MLSSTIVSLTLLYFDNWDQVFSQGSPRNDFESVFFCRAGLGTIRIGRNSEARQCNVLYRQGQRMKL